jgi:hypothetical protein
MTSISGKNHEEWDVIITHVLSPWRI